MTDVSYVVTVYNKAAYLPGCLDAILAQQGDGRREILFVDDGSTDGSGDLLRGLAASRGLSDVRVLSQANAGPGPATNAGAPAARGTWLKLVDAELRFRLMPFPADMRALMQSRIEAIGLKPEPAP